MGCHFPGASSPSGLWQSVLDGRREFRPLPPERLPEPDYADPDPRLEDQTYARELAVLTDWSFDPARWGIAPITAESSDVTHWLALTTAAAAIEHAGVDLDAWDRGRVGVVLGNTLGGEFGRTTSMRMRWPYIRRALERAFADRGELLAPELLDRFRHHFTGPLPAASEDTLPGAMANTIVGRICNRFDLGGGGFTVDGACASSLVALARACEALQSGAWDLALCGGVDVSLDPFELVGFAKTRALAPEDIRPYDARAEGMLPGEGCGVVVLVRLEQAERLGLHVHALIRGWGVSSDGKGSITAPQAVGQLRALERAWASAGCNPASADLFEGHGTGTRLGDQVEIEALLRLLADAPAARRRWLGSIKGNIGHCKAAAGSAGLIKAAMALSHAIIPPTAGCVEPNPIFHRGRGRLLPALEPTAWTAVDHPRRAGVSAFGFGGINAHVVLEEAAPKRVVASPRAQLRPRQDAREPALLAASASSVPELIERLRSLRPFLSRASRSELYDLAVDLAGDLGEGPIRAAFVVDTPRSASARLDSTIERLEIVRAEGQLGDADRPKDGIHVGRCPQPGAPRPEIVALFPGQGSQRPGMSRRVWQRCPESVSRFEQLDTQLADLLPEGLVQHLRWDPRLATASERALAEARVESTAIAQPGVVASSLLWLEVLRDHGVEPTIMLGHSLGEISALAAAGAVEAVDAIRLAARRGSAIAALDLDDRGAMLAVGASAEQVEPLLVGAPGIIVVANHNAPAQVVLAGETRAIRWADERVRGRGWEATLLPVSHAFHSPLMAPACGEVEAAARAVEWGSLRAKLASTTSGEWLPERSDLAGLLGAQVTAPVRFAAALAEVAALGPKMWIEVGPGSSLINLVRASLGPDVVAFELDPRDANAPWDLPAVLARAWVLGQDVDLLRWARAVATRSVDRSRPPRPSIVNPCEQPYRPPKRPSETTTAIGDSLEQAARLGQADEALGWTFDWLSQRAGFPRDSLRPEHGLREDLNLDSIKAIELLTALSARYQRSLPALHQWERLSLGELARRIVDAPSIDLGERDPLPAGVDDFDAGYCARSSTSFVPMPLQWAPQPPAGPPSVVLSASTLGPSVDALGLALTQERFAPLRITHDQLRKVSGAVGAMVWLIDEGAAEGRPGSGEAEAEQLVELARWSAARGEANDTAPLRLIVVRRVPDPLALDEQDAGAALLSSLAHERSVPCRWLRVPSVWSPARLGAVLARELRAGGDHVLTAWDREGLRHVEVSGPNHCTPARPAIDRGELVIVSGGAQGVTLELARCLGRTTGASLGLLGRSPAESDVVREGLARLAADRVRARYYRCDVVDAEQVHAAVRAAVDDFGPARGLLHGAGISRPMPLDEIDLDIFRACVRVKVRGLINLWQALDQPKLLHVVSSVLGHTGMARQLDYAFANAWLSGFAARLQRERPELHVLSLGYSVWQEVGLGVSLGAVDPLRSLGVRALSTEQAVAAYERELGSRSSTPRRIITGRLIPELERRLHPRLPPRRARFLEQVVRFAPGVELVSLSTLDHARDIYLHDHVFEGTPIVPAVMVLEAMTCAAATCIGRSDLVEVHDWELVRAVPVPEDAKTRIRVHARVLDADAARAIVRVGVRAEVDGFREECFHARLVFGAATDVEPPVIGPLPPPEPLSREQERRLFQGPLFRWLSAARRIEPDVLGMFDARTPGALRYFEASARETLTPYPALRDALLQTILLVNEGEGSGLPVRIACLRMVRPAAPGSELLVLTRAQANREWSIDVLTRDGRLVEALSGIVIEAPATSNERPEARRAAGSEPSGS